MKLPTLLMVYPHKTTNFIKRLNFLKKNKEKIYAQIKAEAQEPETIAYYNHVAAEEIDLEILNPEEDE